MSAPRSLATLLPALLLAGLVAGCASSKTKPAHDPSVVAEAEAGVAELMKANPAPDSGFLTDADKMEEHRERAPFNRMWVAPEFSVANYHSIVVAPVNTEHVIQESTWAKMNLRNIVASPEDDLERFAGDFRHIVIEKFSKSELNRFAIVDSADDQTMILELAITELVPGKAFLGAIGLAAWAAPLPVGIPAGAVASFAQVGWMAIEGRVRDPKTGRVMARFADREGSKTRILDLEALTWYGHAQESMNDWAEQFVLLANTPNDIQVEDSSWFRLRPW